MWSFLCIVWLVFVCTNDLTFVRCEFPQGLVTLTQSCNLTWTLEFLNQTERWKDNHMNSTDYTSWLLVHPERWIDSYELWMACTYKNMSRHIDVNPLHVHEIEPLPSLFESHVLQSMNTIRTVHRFTTLVCDTKMQMQEKIRGDGTMMEEHHLKWINTLLLILLEDRLRMLTQNNSVIGLTGFVPHEPVPPGLRQIFYTLYSDCMPKQDHRTTSSSEQKSEL